MTALANIALANKRISAVKPWHEALAKQIDPSAVFHLFLDCDVYDNFIVFKNIDKFRSAEKYARELKQVFPTHEMRMFDFNLVKQ